MIVLTEEQCDSLGAITDKTERIYEAAKALATSGIQVFPCRAYDGAAFDKAYQEYIEEKTAAAKEHRRAKIPQKHFKQHGGKAPAEGLGDQYAVATVNLAQIERWWHPTKGKYRGNNIGVSTGKSSDLVVVDLDVKPEEGVDGFEWWNALVSVHGDVDTFRVRSGGQSSGGQHLYFRWREGVETRNGLASGVDIRVERSHVVAPFSQCQGVYTAITFELVADIPDWLYGALTARGSKNLPAGSKSVRMVSGDVKGAASGGASVEDAPAGATAFGLTPLDQIEEMLEYLDPNDPDIDGKWKSIMYAIHSEHPTPEGLDVLQAWSKRNPERFDEADNADLWKRANEQKASGATVATLFHLAEEAGWINPRRGVTYVDVPKAVRMMNKSFAIIDADRYVEQLAMRGKRFDNSRMPPGYYPPMTIYKTREVLTDDPNGLRLEYGKAAEVNYESMLLMTSRFKVLQELPGGKAKVSSLREVWMQSPARRSYVSAGYYVDPANCPDGVLNLFPGWQAKPKEGTPKLFVKHIKDIICQGDEERYNWLMNRLAYVVQYGDEIAPTAVTIKGAHGNGKSIIGDYLERMVGTLNYKYLHDAEAIKTKFSEELVGKFIIVADEAIFSGDEGLRNKMKSLIASKNLREEGKGKAAKDAQNVMFIIILSNENEPVSIEEGDRRYTVLTPSDFYAYKNTVNDPVRKKMAQEYFKALAAEMNGDGPSHLLRLLLDWNVDKALARTPIETDEKQGIIESRLFRTDSLSAYFYYLYSTGWGMDVDPIDPNPDPQTWGGRLRTGPAYETYTDWVKEQKSNHRNSAWKAEPLNRFTTRLVEEFGCRIVKPSGKSTILMPQIHTIRDILAIKFPEAMKKDAEITEE